MRSNPIFAVLALMAAGFLIRLTWHVLTDARGERLIQFGLVFGGLVFVFKMVGFLTGWAVIAALITFPLALLAYAYFQTNNDIRPTGEQLVQAEVKVEAEEYNQNRLTFNSISGVGVFNCLECGYQQNLVGFTHGSTDHTGYQCQSCFSFSTHESEEYQPTTPPPCSCGGDLSRDAHVRCPKCHHFNVDYDMTYIT